VTYEVKYKEII